MTERTLTLLSTLQTGGSFSGEELSRRLGVSPRTLRRDVERLRGYGYPVDTRPGPGGHYRLAAGRTMPPLVLGDDEAVATLLALASLASASSTGTGGEGAEGDAGVDGAAATAYGKLEQFLPARLRPRVAAVRASLDTGGERAPSVPAGHIALLAAAIAEREVVTFGYTDARGRRSERRAEPYRQVHHLLRWYLLAWDVHRGDWRMFRLDRITEPLRTGERYGPRTLPAASALEYLRQGLNRGREPVRLVIEAPAARVADALKYQDAEIVPLSARRTRVSLALDTWEWLLLPLASLDADFALELPERSAREIRDFAERLLTATSAVPAEGYGS